MTSAGDQVPSPAVSTWPTSGVVSLTVGTAVLVITGCGATALVAAEVAVPLAKPSLVAVTRIAKVLPDVAGDDRVAASGRARDRGAVGQPLVGVGAVGGRSTSRAST